MFSFLKKIFKSEVVARKIFEIRVSYLIFKNKIKTLQSKDGFSVTVDHNIKAVKKPLNRMNLLIRPLSVLENVSKDARVLVIGPRNEWDLFLLWLSGFDFQKCHGLDLISYSPKITLGDMHDIPFDSGSFDVVLCGWTLSYSANPKRAASEIERVCKKDGVIGVGVEYSDIERENAAFKDIGYHIQEKDRLPERINSTSMILDLFDCGKQVFFNHDAPLKDYEGVDFSHRTNGYHVNNCVVIFSKK